MNLKKLGRVFLSLIYISVGIFCLIALSSGATLWDIFTIIACVVIVHFGLVTMYKYLFVQSTNRKVGAPTKQLEQHYQQLGLSSREISVFRDTMASTKELIERLQANLTKNSKLKAIDLRHNTTKAAKALFKELVKEPNKLHFASQFLYTHLPNLVDLTDKYVEISQHEIKSKETYDRMEESIVVIDQLAALIAKDYSQFVSDDFDDLDVELSLAKQSIKQETK